MPSVQLVRLRSQINAVLLHFDNRETFCNSLKSLLELYQNKKTSSNQWMHNFSTLKMLNVSDLVTSEMEARLVILAKEKSSSAIENADSLWNTNIFELKKTAITLLINLDPSQMIIIVNRIHEWINPGLDRILISEFLQKIKSSPHILINDEWVSSLGNWLSSKDDEVVRLGLSALSHTVNLKYKNLPDIFSSLVDVMKDPKISIQKELTNVIQELILYSQAETASFLIMCSKLFPTKNVLSFIRKCIPLFNEFFQFEIQNGIK